MRSVGRFLYANNLTVLSFIVCIVVLTGIQQVSHIMFHLPTPELSALGSLAWLDGPFFWLFVILLLSGYALLAANVIPVEPKGLIDSTVRILRKHWVICQLLPLCVHYC